MSVATVDVWVTVVDADSATYDGPRIQVSASELDAWADLADWLSDVENVADVCPEASAFLENGFQVRAAMDAWSASTGKFWKIEQQQLALSIASKHQIVAASRHRTVG